MHPDSCKSFKILGLFLCYPQEDWLDGVEALCALLEQEKLLRQSDFEAVRAEMSALKARDLFDLQEEYVETFDRVRSLSLHLFEHVHGDSRDRGQAMVDLAQRYQEHGVQLAQGELPDYLPVFLEYLSLLPRGEALEEISEIGHILVGVGKRLAERGSGLACVFNALIHLAGRKPAEVAQVARPEPVPFDQLDREWEERPIDFLGAASPDSGCSSGCSTGCASTPSPLDARQGVPL